MNIYNDPDFTLPSEMDQVIRFDPNGFAAQLGSMTASGLEELMGCWFDCGFALFVTDSDDVVCLLPIWYAKNDKTVPERMTRSMSMHMTMWQLSQEEDGDGGWTPESN